MTGRACMGEVLTQVWLKSVKKQVSYLTQTSECTKRQKLPGLMPTPPSQRKKCAMKMKEEKKR